MILGLLLAFRAVDTLGESIVLVLALVGLWSLAPDAAWGGRPGFLRTGPSLLYTQEDASGADLILVENFR